MVSHRDEVFFGGGTPVLILIVMDNGLSLTYIKGRAGEEISLNPYCNG